MKITFLEKKINEIKNSNFLSYTGMGLAFSHFISFFYWKINPHSVDFLQATYENVWPICFPFFKNCADYSLYKFLPFNIIFLICILISIFCIFCFYLRKTKIAYILMLLLVIFKTFIWLSRYNFMGNYHTMHTILCLCFLFLGNTKTVYILFLCSMYFCAGLLKLNYEWLSGAALTGKPFLNGTPLSLALAYVIVLEIFLVWGLLSKKFILRTITLLQLIIFHIYSYDIVGSFYPLIMLGILFPLIMNLREELIDSTSIESFAITKTQLSFFSIWLAFNIWPHFSKQDSALDGHNRFLRMNMLDARSQCKVFFIKNNKRKTEFLFIPDDIKSLRVHCDPVIYESYLKKYCSYKENNKKLNIDYLHYAKRTVSDRYEKIRFIKDYCEKL